MATLKVEYKGKNYELGFTRNTVVAMERNGFNIGELGDKPMTMIPMLWHGAFAAYNRGVKRDLIDEIYKKIPDKERMFEALSELYADTVNTLTAEPDDDEGNATWEIVR